jgi:hypothetical protein
MSFDVPEGWTDRTILAFAAPSDDPKDHQPNVVMTREDLAEGDTVRTHADRTLLDMAKNLEGFDILESRETTLGGLRAVHLRFKWKSNAGELEQGMTLCEGPPQPGDKGRFATIITTTAQDKALAEVRPYFDRLLSSFQFARAGGPPPGAPPPPADPIPDGNAGPVFGVRRR